MTHQHSIVVVGHVKDRRGTILQAAHAAISIFEAHGYHTVLLGTDSSHSAGSDGPPWGQPLDQYLSSSDTPPAAVVAVGGDGTAHIVANSVLEYQQRTGHTVVFGVIARGSGNDLVRHWRGPRADPYASAGRIVRLLRTGPKSMDVGQVRFPDGRTVWFTTALCAGIDAAATERANQYRLAPRSIKYFLALLHELFFYSPHEYAIEITDHTGEKTSHRYPALMVNVANTSSIGGGIKIVPHADPTDGKLELFVVSPLKKLRFIRLLPTVFTGRHLEVSAVHIQHGTRIHLDGNHPLCADGERIGELPATVSVQPAALSVAL